jgi:hypothetical protein
MDIYIDENKDLVIIDEFLNVISASIDFEKMPLDMQTIKQDVKYLDDIPAPLTGSDLKKNINIYKTIGEHIILEYNFTDEIKNLLDIKKVKKHIEVDDVHYHSDTNLPEFSIEFKYCFKVISEIDKLQSLIKDVNLKSTVSWKDNFADINYWQTRDDFCDECEEEKGWCECE